MSAYYKPKLKLWRGQVIKNILIFVLLLFFISVTAILSAFAYFSKDLPNPNRLKDREVIQSTRIYDRTGEILLFDVYKTKKRTLIPLDQIPSYAQWATIVAEDENFLRHNGFDLRGILRALLKDIQSGRFNQGGSTITQQLIKNTILTPEKTLKRKIKEIILSLELERKFSKQDILQIYLNEIPYGSNIYGIEAATQTFFNIPAKNLNLAQGALLAALPRAPTHYSPYGSRRDELMGRQRVILKKLFNLGYIDENEYQEALNFKLTFSIPNPIKAPHFVMYIREQLVDKFGERAVEEGGFKIITTIDMKLQALAENIIDEESKKNLINFGAKNASLVAINPNNGDILAMVGSRDYFDLENDGNVNVALRPRQPGSAIKPFIYATAFKKGYTPNTIVFDLLTDFGPKGDGTNYVPENYDNKFRGPVTLRQALAMSLNIPSVKVLYLAGIKDSIKTAHDLGITTLNDISRYGLSLVLGGGEVKLFDAVSAYGVFATEGLRYPSRGILKIIGPDGTLIEDNAPKAKRVLDQEIARIVTNVLSDNEARAPVFGANSNLYLGARPVAAKTGTTQEYRDGWLIGYTPQLASGVWVGNNDNSRMKNLATGGRVAGEIWNRFMKSALEGKEIIEFSPPSTLKEEPLKQFRKVRIDKLSGKLATDLTPPQLVEEKIFPEVHSILYYINQNDPQFSRWERPVLAWAREHNYNASIPTIYDDIHIKQNQPQIKINNLRALSGKIQLNTEITAPLGVKQVDFFFDGNVVATDSLWPFSAYFSLPTTTAGEHIVSIKAYDRAGNVSEVSETISLPLPNPL